MRPDDVLDAAVDRREIGPVMAAQVYAAALAASRARTQARVVAVLGWSLVVLEAAGWAALWVWIWGHG